MRQELLPTPATGDRVLVRQLTSAADIDAIFMHGPHVVQPFEIVNGTPCGGVSASRTLAVVPDAS